MNERMNQSINPYKIHKRINERINKVDGDRIIDLIQTSGTSLSEEDTVTNLVNLQDPGDWRKALLNSVVAYESVDNVKLKNYSMVVLRWYCINPSHQSRMEE